MWVFSCKNILLIHLWRSTEKFLSGSSPVCASVCLYCVCICEREWEKENMISIHKKGGKHENIWSSFSLLFVISICSVSFGVLVLLLF